MFLFWIIALLCFLGIGILCLILWYTPSIKNVQGNTLQGSIASLEKVNLRGKEQWRGKISLTIFLLIMYYQQHILTQKQSS